MRAIHINAEDRTINEVQLDPVYPLESMQRCVGGPIEHVHTFANGDELYVNEEALMGDFFEVKYAHQPFTGNGVIVNGNEYGETLPAKSPVADIVKVVKFYTYAGNYIVPLGRAKHDAA